MNLETEACLLLWRPQKKDLRIRILINDKTCQGMWTLYNRRTKKTLVQWESYSFSTSAKGPTPERDTEVLVKQLDWLSNGDRYLPPHHLEALLILKQELHDT